MNRRDRRNRELGETLDTMLVEIGDGEPRQDAYWAQQVAFGPLVVHCLALRIRAGGLDDREKGNVARILGKAFDLLGALPDGPGGDPAVLPTLATRQALALANGRRKLLARLASRLGAELPASPGCVPSGALRIYELLGW